jgi:hypothetical protein
MILWNSAQTSKEIRKYLTIVNIFFYNVKYIVLTVYVGFFAGAKFRDFFLALLNFDDP